MKPDIMPEGEGRLCTRCDEPIEAGQAYEWDGGGWTGRVRHWHVCCPAPARPGERHVLHLTLQTGHVRKSYRSEIADAVVEALRPVLRRAMQGKHVPVPGRPGYTLRGGVHGRCCVVTLFGQGAGTRPVPIVSFAVGGHSRCAARLWRVLHARPDHRLATDPERVPPGPWVADRLDVGVALHHDALEWTGDLSRSVAHTWLQMRERGR